MKTLNVGVFLFVVFLSAGCVTKSYSLKQRNGNRLMFVDSVWRSQNGEFASCLYEGSLEESGRLYYLLSRDDNKCYARYVTPDLNLMDAKMSMDIGSLVGGVGGFCKEHTLADARSVSVLPSGYTKFIQFGAGECTYISTYRYPLYNLVWTVPIDVVTSPFQILFFIAEPFLLIWPPNSH